MREAITGMSLCVLAALSWAAAAPHHAMVPGDLPARPVTPDSFLAEVEQGLDVLDRLNGRYGNAPIENDSLSILGGEYLQRAFPGLDRIERARVTKTWGSRAR